MSTHRHAARQHIELHESNATSRLNRLRAAVLGANDGIVSIAGLVVGVAGASSSKTIILAAGLAGLAAGALSMAAGEYVSVSSQRDTEQALLEKERLELEQFPERELEELTQLYEEQGLSEETARQVAQELTEHDAFAAHVQVELNIDPTNLVNPWQAATASAVAFLVGAFIPLLAILIPPANLRVPVTVVAVLIALLITGVVSARFGQTNMKRATFRVVLGGALAMLVTFTLGRLSGSAHI